MTELVDAVVRRIRETQALAKFVGEAPSLTKVIATIPIIAQHDGTVLISGETGTGKELVARAIHYLSDRADHPIVCINCGSLPDLLVEDTLFGHEAGAFTDARLSRRGLLAEADRGTLFLDEVEALGARAQATLLRVLQDGTFHALGSTSLKRTDARVVAATNAPLERMVLSGAFRADLYHRLRVFFVDLPPLRERRSDVLLLASHFLRQRAPSGKGPLDLSEAAKLALTSHSWPGNIRELENTILRATAICQTGVIIPADLGIPSDGISTAPDVPARSYRALKREAIATFDRNYLTGLMTEHHGNVTHAARTAGKDRRELGKLLKKYGVDPRPFRAA
jgi:DNA-binding NtrC family response regulator